MKLSGAGTGIKCVILVIFGILDETIKGFCRHKPTQGMAGCLVVV